MINKLPEEVWSNPDLKWLDPCNGCGIFPSVIVKRLMEGLREWEPEEDKRYKHIMENMIYVCELQAKNMFLYLCAFDPEDVYLLNIFHGSFLSDEFDRHMKNEWKVEKFDVIIGNPPYQELKEGAGNGFSKSQAIWHIFVEKGLFLAENKGLFSMIHPSGWRDIKGMFKNTQRLILDNNDIIYLSMNTSKDGIRSFGCTTDFDWYVLSKNSYQNKLTEVKQQDGEICKIYLKDKEFIPGAMIDSVYGLIAKHDEKRVDVLYSRSAYGTDKINISKEKDDIFKYPCVYTCGKKGNINFRYSCTNQNGHFGIPKVFWSNGAASSVHIDSEGEYGLTEFAYAIADDANNLENIKKAMESEKFIELMKWTQLNNDHRYNRKIISLFRKDFWKEFINAE
jgi:hypothetical protein